MITLYMYSIATLNSNFLLQAKHMDVVQVVEAKVEDVVGAKLPKELFINFLITS